MLTSFQRVFDVRKLNTFSYVCISVMATNRYMCVYKHTDTYRQTYLKIVGVCLDE